MSSSISTDIDIPPGLQAILMDADEITRYRIYVRLKQINIPRTDPRHWDQVIRLLADVCQI